MTEMAADIDQPGEPQTARRSKSLTEMAYASLRERIITGDMPPGMEVSEPELAEQLSVSKTPVREALARLCVEGFMEAYPRRGYRVTPVTVKDMNDLFAIREMLEGSAAALAAENLTAEELDELDRLADVNYELGENASVRSFVEANQAFHAAIARASRNPRLHALVISHLEECARLFYMGARMRDVNPETNRDHHEIVEVLRKRDAQAARAAMVRHNENTRVGILTALISNGRSGLTL
jgi:DNA-binding GntR family transcriptional regulator